MSLVLEERDRFGDSHGNSHGNSFVNNQVYPGLSDDPDNILGIDNPNNEIMMVSKVNGVGLDIDPKHFDLGKFNDAFDKYKTQVKGNLAQIKRKNYDNIEEIDNKSPYDMDMKSFVDSIFRSPYKFIDMLLNGTLTFDNLSKDFTMFFLGIFLTFFVIVYFVYDSAFKNL